MLEAYRKLKTKPKTITELTEVLPEVPVIWWGNLSQGPIDKAVKDFSKRLKACVVLELAVDTSNIHSDSTLTVLFCCLNDVTELVL